MLLIIGVISLLYKMPSAFELRLDECGKLIQTELRLNELYVLIYNTYGYVMFLIVIPWAIMIILNVTVVRAVHNAYRKRQSLVEGGIGSRVDDKERRFVCLVITSSDELFSCTIMALVMLSTFIAFNLLAGLNNVIEAFTVYTEYKNFRIPLGNLLVCVNRFVFIVGDFQKVT